MAKKYLAGIDIGTTGFKSDYFRSSGGCARRRIPGIPLHVPETGMGGAGCASDDLKDDGEGSFERI